jgi:membrane protein DedA with SNARE-associated domain
LDQFFESGEHPALRQIDRAPSGSDGAAIVPARLADSARLPMALRGDRTMAHAPTRLVLLRYAVGLRHPADRLAMTLTSLVGQYGLWAVFAGALAEGEAVLLVAGYAAHRGLLKLPEVMFVAFVASALGDQLYFFLGRRHGPKVFARFASLAGHAQRVQPLLSRYPNALILGMRFMYGLRTAGPIALGAMGVPPLKFVALNLLGAAVWAAAIATIGYQFGNALQWLLDDLRSIEEGLLATLLLAGLAWAIYRRVKSR